MPIASNRDLQRSTQRRIQRSSHGAILLCLILCAGCAEPIKEYVTVERCPLPTARLAPTPEPAMSDETNGALLREIEGKGGWRSTLRSCNRDKADAEALIQYINSKPMKEGSK